MNKLNWEWLAGFWEGDGCAGCYYNTNHNHKSWRLHADISQQEKQILILISRFIGYGKLYYSKTNNVWSWRVENRQARNFLTKILPYCNASHKIKQIKKSLALDKKYVNPR